jgi:hypothetical protein
MGLEIINQLKMKLNQWFSEPLGDVGIVTDSTQTELKKIYESFETPKFKPVPLRGRGDLMEIQHRIEEFHPRGAAGRREIRRPRGAQKAVMPHLGSRQKYPK